MVILYLGSHGERGLITSNCREIIPKCFLDIAEQAFEFCAVLDLLAVLC
jgi:hypothetical protein